MPRPNPVRQTTFAEFLELEAKSSVRHEFVDGFMFAMAGGTDYHNQIAINALIALRSAAESAGCSSYLTDMLLQTPGGTYYPDVFVTCEETNDGSRLKHTACLIIEVLSDSTEALDRGDKLRHYQKLSGLKMYLLVSQQEKRVEVFQRLEDGSWRYEDKEEGQLRLPCINVSLELEDLYRGLSYPRV